MAEAEKRAVLELKAVEPDTASTVQSELTSRIEAALSDVGKGQLLTNGELQITIERTFPTDQLVVIGLTLLSGVALETYKEIVLPMLKRWVEVKIRSSPDE